MLTESTYCESDTDENNNNNRKIDRILLDSRSSSEDEYFKSDERKAIRCDMDIENYKTLICKFNNRADLRRNLPGNNQLPTWIKCFETLEIQMVQQEDTVNSEKVQSPIFCSDDNFPALDSGKERKDCSKSLAKAQQFGVNPFQIGILINKSDFLEHCRMVKNGSLNHCIKNRRASNHIEKERLEQFSTDLELTADEECIATAPAIETKSGHAMNVYSKTSCVKLSSSGNVTRKAKKFDKEINKKTIDLSHSKSVSDLIQHFESNCSGNPHKKKRDCSRSIKRNRKTNYSIINRDPERETEIPTQYKRDRLEHDLLACSMQKANDSFVYNMSDGSSHESLVVSFVQLENLSDSSVDNQSELLALLEVFWYLVVMITIFWHLIVM